jgi:hypothetical protein
MNRYLVGGIYGRPSINIAHFVAIEIDQSETKIACGSHASLQTRRNEQSLWRTFQGCFLPNFSSFGNAVSLEKIFLEIIQSEGNSFL